MADVNRGNRPLSPHVSIYGWPLNAMMSIFHRATGVAMLVSAALIVWWFLAASTSPAYFEMVDGLLTSWVGNAVMTLSVLGLWYHFANGIRHLFWDLGFGFADAEVTSSGYLALAVAAILTIATILFA